MPERFEVVVDRTFDPLRLVALFNFDDEAKDLEHKLPPGLWHAFEVWGERYLGVREGAVRFALVEPHGCRVVALRPAGDAPALIGTTAHVGAGGLDITNTTWQEPTLTVEVAPAGRRKRNLFVATMGRSVESVQIDREAARFETARESCVIPLEVDATATIEVTFGG